MSNQEPVSLGWGRAAAMRFVKSEAEIRAEIMKALEGKLSSEFQVVALWIEYFLKYIFFFFIDYSFQSLIVLLKLQKK